MTGFGIGRASLGDGEIVVEARAVNHRFMDVRVKFPPELASATAIAEDVIRKRLVRGRVEVSGRLEGGLRGKVRLNRARAVTAYRDLVALRDELAPGEPVPLGLLAAVPDLFESGGEDERETVEHAVRRAADDCCTALHAMRHQEGIALSEDLKRRLDQLRKLRGEIAQTSRHSVSQHAAKLEERLARLLGTAELDPQRLAQEVAILVDRGDISEELTRFESHVDQFAGLLSSDQPAGRKMDFLLQELLREANTIGSKSVDATVSHLVIEVKAEVERIREQVQNVL